MKRALIIGLGIVTGLILLIGINSNTTAPQPSPQIQGVKTQAQIGQSSNSPSNDHFNYTTTVPTHSSPSIYYSTPKPSSKMYSPPVTSGATAICNDGTYSYSQNRRGTCSHHGGVAQWL